LASFALRRSLHTQSINKLLYPLVHGPGKGDLSGHARPYLYLYKPLTIIYPISSVITADSCILLLCPNLSIKQLESIHCNRFNHEVECRPSLRASSWAAGRGCGWQTLLRPWHQQQKLAFLPKEGLVPFLLCVVQRGSTTQRQIYILSA
jgi:hypothetical protein